MNRFWADVIEPLARALRPATIVEIGSDEGAGTEKLLRFSQQAGAVLHVIDPKPSYDPNAWQTRWGDTLVYHPRISLEALPNIAAMDLVLVDGDHNWHTVRSELEAIHRASVGAGRAFPLTLLHDVEWPYGRRDLYYDPSTVPEAARQSYASAGMIPGQSELVRGGGYNPHQCNAVHEGGARNGVRTAIDDFIADHADEDYTLIVLPVLFGIGILYRKADPRTAELQQLLDSLTQNQLTVNLIALAERERVAALIEAQEKDRLIEVLQTRIAAAERTLKNDQAAMAQIRNRELRANAQFAALQDRWSKLEKAGVIRAWTYLERVAHKHPRAYRLLRRAARFASGRAHA